MVEAEDEHCAACGAPLRPGARFCGACGARVGDRPAERGGESGAIIALAVTFAGALLTIIVAGVLLGERPTLASAAAYVGFGVVGLVGAAALGKGALRETLAGPASERWVAAGLGLGALAFGFSFGYVELLALALGGDGAVEPSGRSLLVELVDVAGITPIVEEWLCRGVLFVACSRVVGPRATLLLTTALFALLHGLQGHVLAVPHRFVAGLAFGWLRARSGSLVPGIAAHALHNALAVLVGRV
ncbi:MAG: CPBP family intramembrane glutamic endopeptidase [Planctomycetota bacterium]